MAVATLVLAATMGAAVTGCSSLRGALVPLDLARGEGLSYDLRIQGAGDKLEARLRDASLLVGERAKPPATLAGLQRRSRADHDSFLRVLRSRGWYDGTVRWDIDSARKPARVTMHVDRGPRFVFGRLAIEGLPADAQSLDERDGLASLGLVAGQPALAGDVLKAETAMLAALSAKGHPLARLLPREAILDRASRELDVVFHVDAGPRVRFGEVRVEGLARVQEAFVRGRVAFHRGQEWSPVALEETRRALFASGVFSAVGVRTDTREEVTAGGELPISIRVTEGEAHSVGAGVKYSSSEGFGAKGFWEHRNVSGRADRFRAEVEASQQLTTGAVAYHRPDWLRVGQTLLLDAKAESDKPPAYDRYALSLSAGVERTFRRHLVGTAGMTLEQADVNSAADADGTRRFTLVGAPLGLRYDRSDNLLDPARGSRTLLSATPWASVLGDQVQLLALRATESAYLPLARDRRVVWASRVTLGSVLGAGRNQVPADKRLYAGGGDSVRGYGYQFLGPLRDIDASSPSPTGKPDYKPLGGRSLLQVGSELRWKLTDTFGLVPFVEGAGVFEQGYPDFREDFLWGAGLGLRYYTVAGPIRLDLAFPLNPRPSDQVFQLYISLGQAF